jgi:hypothetical protein
MLPHNPNKPRKPLVRKVGLKPSTKRMRSRKRAIPKPTKAQQDYQDRARALGCIVCRWLLDNGWKLPSQCGPTRIHHRNQDDKHGQPQLGQAAVVALGDWHHDGILLPGYTTERMRATFGPSFKYGRDFRNWTADLLPDVPGRGTEVWQRVQDDYLDKRAAA